jgi:hypothetical protein
MLIPVEKPLSSLSGLLEEFSTSFIQSRLEIPVEVGLNDWILEKKGYSFDCLLKDPPVLLRLFAKRETLALVYHNLKTGQVLSPQLRACPENQQRDILDTFWKCFAGQGSPGMAEYSITRGLYRFYAW